MSYQRFWPLVLGTLSCACFMFSLSIVHLADFSVSAADEIRLQASLTAPAPTDPATLNGVLHQISIRTALEDTQRLRYELG